MTEPPDADIRRIYERWHETVLDRDIDGLIALYAEDALFESPLVLAGSRIATSGILRGKPAIRDFLAEWLRKPRSGLGRWYRTGTFFSNGRQLTWEYPRDTPDGDQIDLIEMIDLADGLIAHHRVYWGWVGFQALVPILDEARR